MIGVEGEWDPQDPNLVNWTLEMSDELMPSVVEPIDGSIWGQVVRNLTAGKPQDKTAYVASGKSTSTRSHSTPWAGCVGHVGRE